MKTLSIVKYVFSLIGIGLMAGSFFSYKSTNTFIKEASKANGIVIDFITHESDDSSATYSPVVQFKDQTGLEIEFSSSMSSNPPSYSIGEEVEVLFRPNKPQDAQINGFFSLWGLALITGGLGSIFFLIGFGMILYGILKNRKAQYLINNGTPIKTVFHSVELNGSLNVNGKHPYRLLTQWDNPTTSKRYIFKSNNIWFDPTDNINDRMITVYIEQNNPKKYFVDLSFLPEVIA